MNDLSLLITIIVVIWLGILSVLTLAKPVFIMEKKENEEKINFAKLVGYSFLLTVVIIFMVMVMLN